MRIPTDAGIISFNQFGAFGTIRYNSDANIRGSSFDPGGSAVFRVFNSTLNLVLHCCYQLALQDYPKRYTVY